MGASDGYDNFQHELEEGKGPVSQTLQRLEDATEALIQFPEKALERLETRAKALGPRLLWVSGYGVGGLLLIRYVWVDPVRLPSALVLGYGAHWTATH